MTWYGIFWDPSALLNANLSNLLGWSSVACWFIVGFPQFYTNYKLKSGDGLAMSFLLIWLFGDAFNLVGCYITNQLVSEIVVAWWYTIMDIVLIGQIIYYDRYYKHTLKDHEYDALEAAGEEQDRFHSETTPILSGSRHDVAESSVTSIVGSLEKSRNSAFDGMSTARSYPRREFVRHMNDQEAEEIRTSISHQNSTDRQTSRTRLPTLPAVLLIGTFGLRMVIANMYFGSLDNNDISGTYNVAAGGAAAYVGRSLLGLDDGLLSMGKHHGHSGEPTSPIPDPVVDSDLCTAGPVACQVGMVMGWISSFLYIVSRFPQIYQNFQRKSCEGVSMMMFVFAVLGNLTYASSIFVFRHDHAFLVEKMPWIVGALGTLLQDAIVFSQFFIYGEAPKEVEEENM
eukprot:Clim_evm26s197 gene=Clim_evmTU26s197